MRPLRAALAVLAAAAICGLTAPPASANLVCRYYKVYDPVNGQVYTYDLRSCGL